MGKGKPRHNQNKSANNMPPRCSYYEDTGAYCEAGMKTDKCNGNAHSCVKQKYKNLAIRRVTYE